MKMQRQCLFRSENLSVQQSAFLWPFQEYITDAQPVEAHNLGNWRKCQCPGNKLECIVVYGIKKIGIPEYTALFLLIRSLFQNYIHTD